MSRVDDWLNHLQEHGYRLTTPRKVVVETVAESQHVLSPLEIYEQARERYSRLGLVTVYRTLEKLEELNLIQRVHRPSDCQAFVAASSGHEHLLICDQCGRVEFFRGDDRMDDLMSNVSKESGFKVEEHWLQLFGVCKQCQ
jgi:Fur family ferric uptake transcriptional regulator